MSTAHDCRDHAEYRIFQCVETHGLDCGPYETWTEEVWICSVCGADESEFELQEAA